MVSLIKNTALLSVAVLLTTFSPAAAQGSGDVELRVSLEVQGRSYPVQGAGVTLMTRPPDVAAAETLARRAVETGRRPLAFPDRDAAYRYYRFQYLVRGIENSRRTEPGHDRAGRFAGRTGLDGTLVIRGLKPGRYYLGVYRQNPLGVFCAWLAPIQVSAGDARVVVLDNSNVSAFYHHRQ